MMMVTMMTSRKGSMLSKTTTMLSHVPEERRRVHIRMYRPPRFNLRLGQREARVPGSSWIGGVWEGGRGKGRRRRG